MNIVFMGTPDFAEASLSALLRTRHTVSAVFTQPDRPRGRGMKESFSPVKALATAHGIPVYQPETFRDGAATELLRSLSPDLLVVVAYGRILPEPFLRVARLGSINVHGSLLPRYRGAAPIQRAIMDGETVTGITAMSPLLLQPRFLFISTIHCCHHFISCSIIHHHFPDSVQSMLCSPSTPH